MQPLILQDMPPLHCGSVQHPCFCASRPDKHLWKPKVFGAYMFIQNGVSDTCVHPYFFVHLSFLLGSSFFFFFFRTAVCIFPLFVTLIAMNSVRRTDGVSYFMSEKNNVLCIQGTIKDC